MRQPTIRVDVKTLPNLTERDVETLQLIACGATNQVLARHFSVSTATTGRRLTELFERLGARDRTHAAVIAMVTGVVKISQLQMPTWAWAELRIAGEAALNGG